MASLAERLRAELGDWHERLPQAWRDSFDEVQLAFDAVDDEAELADDEAIWPQETNDGGPEGAHLFKAFAGMAPKDVRVVVFGNDPYTRISQATGRSFEQGDLKDWAEDLQVARRVSPSLRSLICAAVATSPQAAGYQLTDLRQLQEADERAGRRQPTWFAHVELDRLVADNVVGYPSPTEIFDYWAGQGVLWMNRTLTYTKWLDRNNEDTHRSSHQRVWAPFTRRALETFVELARNQPIVFVMWGSSADDLVPEINEIRDRLDVSPRRILYATTGHPQWVEGYFKVGNPLTQVNYLLRAHGHQINWI